MDILREREQGGFGDRNEYGSRIGGGIDVSGGQAGGTGWGDWTVRRGQLTLCPPRCPCLGILWGWSSAGAGR